MYKCEINTYDYAIKITDDIELCVGLYHHSKKLFSVYYQDPDYNIIKLDTEFNKSQQLYLITFYL